MDQDYQGGSSNPRANDLAERLARASIAGSRYLSQKAESISEQMISLLVRRIILFTFFTVSTFFSIFFALHLGLQYALVTLFPQMPQLAAAFLSAIGILMLSLILLGVLYMNLNSLTRPESK